MSTATMSKMTIHDDENIGTEGLEKFAKFVRGQMVQVNALLMGNTILMGVMVGIGAYGHRYRHHPLTRFLFMGAMILFLPIVSIIVSITGSQYTAAVESGYVTAVGNCYPGIHTTLILVWAAFVQIIGINTTTIVAADDREEGRSIAPPVVLLVQAVWTMYLAVNIVLGPDPYEPTIEDLFALQNLAIFTPFALIFAKIIFKYYAWYSSRQSFSFGRNPRLIVGYMLEQLAADDRINSQHATRQHIIPPKLIVSREDTMVVGKQPHGYRIIYNSSCGGGSISRSAGGDHRSISKKGCLVTLDKIWELDDTLLKSTTQLKDLCFSFALFKMLRCRFAKYTSITEAAAGFSRAHDFLWHFLLEDSDGNRTLGLIASELSFLHDYYYSSLPISYSKDWLPISSIFISLLSIGYCLIGTIVLVLYGGPSVLNVGGQITCDVVSFSSTSTYSPGNLYLKSYPDLVSYSFGSMWFDVLPLLSLDALIMLSEVREIASFICSDWTKVALMCRYISWHEYPTLRKWVGLVLRCRCKLVRPWRNNMNQCSIIVLHPRKFRPVALLRRIIPLPEPKKSVNIPRELKAAIVNTLRSSSKGDDLRNGKISWQQLGIQVGDNFLRALGAQGTCDTLLSWHIATTIFEVRNPHSSASSTSRSVATNMSRYCAYLVAYCPELLPDDNVWSNNMYKATKKGADRALRSVVPALTPELECRQLVELLSTAGSKHEVLKDGARLGEQLVELMKGEEEAAWKALDRFWCEMILHVASSDNLDGHAMAVARGGELITLLWALLTHVGIPEATTTMGASSGMV